MILWHSLHSEEVFKKLATSEEGLNEEEAKKRLKTHGPNRLPQKKRVGRLGILLRQFKSPLIYLLVIAGTVSFLLGDPIDGYIISGAVALSAFFGYFQEQKSEKTLEKLQTMLVYSARVTRRGEERKIGIEELVPGDIILLAEGDKIPADIRLIKGENFETQEAALTGESAPIEKIYEPLDAGLEVSDRANMTFMGTIVARGRALGVVVATGEITEFGKLAKSIGAIKEELTPFQKKIERLAKWVMITIALVVSIIFLGGLLRGIEFREMFVASVAVAVAAIPESLVVAITAILAIGMMRLAKKKALVRKLIAAETLGGTTVICADKTGTLTEGDMKLARIVSDSESLALEIGLLASEAYIENPKEDVTRWNIHGDPMEKAIIKAGIEKGFADMLRKSEEIVLDLMPFESKNQFMCTLLQQGKIYYKGSPEKILGASLFIYDESAPDKTTKLYATHFKKLERIYEDFSREGLRVLAVAYRYAPVEKLLQVENLLSELVFVGLIAFEDPVRQSVKETIKDAQDAGIKVVMITGDHKYTATAVAKQLRLLDHEKVVEGKELSQMDDETLSRTIKHIFVYARILPHDKLRIVHAYQANGEVVAMTGDGVNDAPALKKADIGIAVGSGTDVAKEVAEMVVLDNNFKTVVRAVEEGRVIFENIRKVVTFLLSDSFTEVILIGGSMMLGLPLPVVAAQILWVNLVEDGLPTLALAYEPKEKDVMKLPPRGRQVPLLDAQMKAIIFVIGVVSDLLLLTLFIWLMNKTDYIEYARTMAFAVLGSNSLLYIFSIRSLRHSVFHTNLFSNPYLVGSVLFGFVMMFTAVYTPFLQRILNTIPLSLTDWIIVGSIGILEILGIELAKKIFVEKDLRLKI